MTDAAQVPEPPLTAAVTDLTAWFAEWGWLDYLQDHDKIRSVCDGAARVVLEAAASADSHLHELVFTDREARPATWRTRCYRIDVPLERTMTPAPGSHYKVDCPACIRTAELEQVLADAERALTGMWKAALTVQTTLDKPYPDMPETTPWDRWVKRPAREAHDMAIRLRRMLAQAAAGERP